MNFHYFHFWNNMLRNNKKDIIRYKSFNGFKMKLNLNSYLDRRYYFLNKIYEDVEFLIRKARADDIYVDVGSAVGHTSLSLAPHVKTVYAFEPNEKNFSKLQDNILINQSLNIISYKMALSSKNEYKKLHLSRENDGSHSFNDKFIKLIDSNHDHNEIVCADKFDNMVLESTLVKIDVEGHELEVLKGMKINLKTIRYIALETSKINEKKVVNYLKRNKFMEIETNVNKDHKVYLLYFKNLNTMN